MEDIRTLSIVATIVNRYGEIVHVDEKTTPWEVWEGVSRNYRGGKQY